MFISSLFVIFLAVKTIVQLYLLQRNKAYVRQHSQEVPIEFKEKITLQEHQKAASYTIERTCFSQLLIVFHAVILLLWLPTGLLNSLDLFLRDYFMTEISKGMALFVIFSTISYLLGLPENLYSTFVIEEKFGFNKMTLKLFCLDQIKSILLGGLFLLPLSFLILYLVHKYSDNWWILAWIVVTTFQFIILWAYPVFIAPLFNKFTPIQEGELFDKINDLLERTGFHSNGLFIMDASSRSSHGNAYFTGLGNKKRIVFFDTLLKNLTPNEVQAVLAHELGHFKKKHIQKSLLRSLLLSLILFFLLGQCLKSPLFFDIHFIKNQSSYMALLLFSIVLPIYSYLFTPISSALSRKNEYEADQFAAENSDAYDLISSLVKLYKENASTLTPDPVYSKFYHSHPPALERIKNLKNLVST